MMVVCDVFLVPIHKHNHPSIHPYIHHPPHTRTHVLTYIFIYVHVNIHTHTHLRDGREEEGQRVGAPQQVQQRLQEIFELVCKSACQLGGCGGDGRMRRVLCLCLGIECSNLHPPIHPPTPFPSIFYIHIIYDKEHIRG